MELSHHARERFLETLWAYFAAHGRSDLPWRLSEPAGEFNPYKIMVSELMLQQTQVTRVVPKYLAFLEQFPTAQALAVASLGDVLRAWQGLGYNRRAKFLWQAAQVVSKLDQFPATLEALTKLPGIGPNTAGAILAYAYNRPVLFVETNIRTVYIHHFLAGCTSVSDKEVVSLLGQTLDNDSPREFYWALMDYGSHLKLTAGNANKASRHYTKQSRFDGSRRQIRGQIIRLLGQQPHTLGELRVSVVDDRLEPVLSELLAEGLIRLGGSSYHL